MVSLGPAGFWAGWERLAYQASLCLAMRLARGLRFAMPDLTAHAWSRTLLFARFSPAAGQLSAALVLEEMQSWAAAQSFGLLLREQVHGLPLEGVARGALARPVVIGWGRLDRICLPAQAARAQKLFPDARLHWFEQCGHYPHWDQPAETARLILETTAD